jgi:hypothetical protein
MNTVFILTKESKFLGVFTSVQNVKDFIKNERIALLNILLEEFTFAQTTEKRDVTQLLSESTPLTQVYKDNIYKDTIYKNNIFAQLLSESTPPLTQVYKDNIYKDNIFESLYNNVSYLEDDHYNYEITECDFCSGENCRDYCVNDNFDNY